MKVIGLEYSERFDAEAYYMIMRMLGMNPMLLDNKGALRLSFDIDCEIDSGDLEKWAHKLDADHSRRTAYCRAAWADRPVDAPIVYLGEHVAA